MSTPVAQGRPNEGGEGSWFIQNTSTTPLYITVSTPLTVSSNQGTPNAGGADSWWMQNALATALYVKGDPIVPVYSGEVSKPQTVYKTFGLGTQITVDNLNATNYLLEISNAQAKDVEITNISIQALDGTSGTFNVIGQFFTAIAAGTAVSIQPTDPAQTLEAGITASSKPTAPMTATGYYLFVCAGSNASPFAMSWAADDFNAAITIPNGKKLVLFMPISTVLVGLPKVAITVQGRVKEF